MLFYKFKFVTGFSVLRNTGRWASMLGNSIVSSCSCAQAVSTKFFVLAGTVVGAAKASLILFFYGFCCKMPLSLFRIWLPQVHVEVPTTGSVLLANPLFKLGGLRIFALLLAHALLLQCDCL